MEKLHDPFRLEERLEHKISQGEYIIPLVLGSMLWIAGFVDLLTNTTENGTVFGWYTLPSFIALVVYSLGFGVWWQLIVPRNSVDFVKRVIADVQNRAWLGLGLLAISGALIFTIFEWEPWLNYPLLAAAMLFLILLTLGVFLLARPEPQVKMQWWRKVGLAALGAWVVAEVILQVAAALRVLPVVNTSGQFVAHGRIYQTQEGATDGQTNRLGWYYPEFNTASNIQKIILTGNSYVQAVQVEQKQHMGLLLGELMGDKTTAVMAMGFPDYGLTYADPILYPYTVAPIKPNEVVVLFHLADDIQTVTSPEVVFPYYVVDEAGAVKVHPDNILKADLFWHAAITGYEPLNPILTLQSQLFTLRLLDDGWRNFRNQPARNPAYPVNTATASATAPFGASSFAFEQTDNAQAAQARTVTLSMLKQYQAYLTEQGVTLRLVTIPYFPAQFYAENSGPTWSTELGLYDLLKPERELAEFAAENNLAFLPMGEYMRQTGLSAEEIQQLFFRDGVGRLTPAGHELFAQAMYHCFYSEGNCLVK